MTFRSLTLRQVLSGGRQRQIYTTARSILVKFPSNFFSMRFLNWSWCIHTVALTRPLLRIYPVSFYWRNHMNGRHSIAVHNLLMCMLISLSVNEIWLTNYSRNTVWPLINASFPSLSIHLSIYLSMWQK